MKMENQENLSIEFVFAFIIMKTFQGPSFFEL